MIHIKKLSNNLFFFNFIFFLLFIDKDMTNLNIELNRMIALFETKQGDVKPLLTNEDDIKWLIEVEKQDLKEVFGGKEPIGGYTGFRGIRVSENSKIDSVMNDYGSSFKQSKLVLESSLNMCDFGFNYIAAKNKNNIKFKLVIKFKDDRPDLKIFKTVAFPEKIDYKNKEHDFYNRTYVIIKNLPNNTIVNLTVDGDEVNKLKFIIK